MKTVYRYPLFAFAAVAAAVLLGGCAASGPAGNTIVTADSLDHVRNIIVMPFENESDYEGEGDEIRRAICEEIAKKNLFSLILLNKGDSRLDGRLTTARSMPPLEDMAYLHRMFGADALLQGIVTAYSVYPKATVGLYLRMIDLATGEELLMMDTLWDGNSREIAKRVERYFGRELRKNDIPYDWEVILVSPSLFRHYVGYEVVVSLLGLSAEENAQSR